MKKILFLLLLSGALLTLCAPSLFAQNLRPEMSGFIRPFVGLTGYLGDNNRSLLSTDGGSPFGAGLDAGYQFSLPFSLSAGYMYGNYPLLSSVGEAGVQHTAQLFARYSFGGTAGVAPYLHTGVFVSTGKVVPFGKTAEETATAYGPLIGIGLDIPISNRTSLFVEANARAAFPDDAMDGYDGGGFGSFDFNNNIGAGLRINFRAGSVTPMIYELTGPTQLHVGQEGAYAATVNDDKASRPVEYRWYWGDGTTSIGLDARHHYAQKGTYNIRFMASNRGGSDSKVIVVRVVDAPVPPSILGISAEPVNPDTRTPVRFSASVRGDAPLTYQWAFGDETTATEVSPVHTFNAEGSYTVSLELTNTVGVDRRSMTISVRPYEAEICSEVTEMNAVFFERNTSVIKESAKSALAENVEIMIECPNMNVRIEGLAAPGERQPEQLSADRARAVEVYYREQGILPSRMQTVGLGAPAGVTSKKDGTNQYQRVDTIPLR